MTSMDVLVVLHEPQDLVRHLALADVGVRVAEDVAPGISREKGEHRLTSLTAPGNVVLLDHGVLAEVRDRVEVEVERGSIHELVLAQPLNPGAQQLRDRFAAEPR